MNRMLMATVALTALVAGTAIAQDATSSMQDTMSSMQDTMPSTPMASDTMSSAPMASDMMSSEPVGGTTTQPSTTAAPAGGVVADAPDRDFDVITGFTRIDTDRLASHIIGMPVYDGARNDSNNLGNINDLVLGANGNVEAAIIGVGGFLGLGEKQVAVDFEALQWVVAEDNTERFVIQATIDELTNAPEFEIVDSAPGDAMAPAGDAMSAPAM
jgi:hypothetical protein